MLAEQIAMPQTSQNWKAYLHLALQKHGQKTCLVPQKRYGPLTVQRPFYPELDTCHVYLLHPPGGIVGGDELELIIDAQAQTRSLITTPGATKFYRSAGKTAHIQQKITVFEQSFLEFLPLENIYFPGAKVRSETSIQLKQESQLIFWESHCFGRPANHELFDSGEVTIKLNIANENGLLLTERQYINSSELKRVCGARSYAVLSNMVITTEQIDETLIEQLRAIHLESGISGITQLDDKLLMLRVLSNRTLDSFNYFQAVWSVARHRTMGRTACPPRIWHT